jgi:hypothetical protein
LAFARAGSNRLARMAMIAITTSNSMSVNAVSFSEGPADRFEDETDNSIINS